MVGRASANLHSEGVGVVVLLGVATAENAVADTLHDHVLYPEQMADQHVIDGEVSALTASTHHLQHEIGSLTRAEAIIQQHGQPVPQTVLGILAADRAGIRQDQLRATTLQHERPSTTVTSNELFGALLLTTAAAGVAMMARRIRRNHRETRDEQAQPDIPQL